MRTATINQLGMMDYAGTEAMNTLCSNLSFAGHKLKKIIVTSCFAGEGKSFITFQIMRDFARRGKNVVIVDADLRRSAIVKRFDIRTTGEMKGLVHYLAGQSEMEEIIYRLNIPGAYLIPAGRDIANPLPLLDGEQFPALLDYLASSFDLVLIDSPPVGLVVDAAEMAKSCDGALLVLTYNQTRKRELREAQRQIDQSGCPILGCVLNQVTMDSISSKKYFSKSYYNKYEPDAK